MPASGGFLLEWRLWADPAEDLAVVFMARVPGLQRRRYRPLINSLVYQALTG